MKWVKWETWKHFDFDTVEKYIQSNDGLEQTSKNARVGKRIMGKLFCTIGYSNIKF